MKDILINYSIMLLGVVLHILMKWRDSITKGTKFNFKYHLLLSIPAPIMCVGILIVEPEIGKIGALLSGYSWDSVIKNMEKRYTKKFNS